MFALIRNRHAATDGISAGTRRALLATGLAALMLPCAALRAQDLPSPVTDVRAIEVSARQIKSFERVGGGGNRYGKLEFRGGLVLSSSSRLFGGLSGIVVEPDGKRFIAVSDETGWISGEITYDAAQAPVAMRNVRIGPFHAMAGRTLDRKKDLDAESVALLEGTLARGVVLVGFERNHRIGRFPVIDGVLQNPTGYLKLPPEARRMRSNKGFEAVAVLSGGPFKGSVVAFSERYPDTPTQHTGWIWVRGEPQRLAFPDIGEYEVTDAASLADGSLLVLERRFRWSEWTQGVKMRLRRFPASEVRPYAVMNGEILLEADLSKEIDNMEGLAVHRGQRGETVLTMVSDDNFNSFLQRTLLLQFTLLDDGAKAAARPE